MNFITRQSRALLLTAVLVVGSVCVSNGDNPSALVGQWVSMGDGKSVELFKDGTGAVGDENITWKTEGKRFVLSSWNKSKIGNYNLSGYKLTRTFDDGEVIVWVRKDKVEEYVKTKVAEEVKKEVELMKKAEQRNEKISSYFTDSRDGQKYRSVKIGGKTWMAQNLNYQTGNSWCYNDNNSSCEPYGRLYDENTAKAVCHAGWHLPSGKEWNDLVATMGGAGAGKKLKSTYGWAYDGNGIDEFGFSALPGGYRNYYGYGFSDARILGCWWMVRSDFDSYMFMVYKLDDVRMGGYDKKNCSVRCVKDDEH
jgi:uncharacterized protein (TIGR02145 family)